jgi:membrane-associated phospholipid phosphatase
LKEINPRNPDSHVWMQTSNSVYFAPLSIAATQMAYGIITKNKRARNKSCELLMSIGLGTLISQNMKVAVNRTRPQDKYPNEIFSLSPTHTKSFPSGHTAMAFATATTLTLQYKKWYVAAPAYAWALGVSYSRMYEGKHYPTDILAGAVIGTGSGFLCHWLSKKLFKER